MIKKLLFTEHDVIREAEAFEAVNPEMFLVPSLPDPNNLFLRIRAFYWLHFWPSGTSFKTKLIKRVKKLKNWKIENIRIFYITDTATNGSLRMYCVFLISQSRDKYIFLILYNLISFPINGVLSFWSGLTIPITLQLSNRLSRCN